MKSLGLVLLLCVGCLTDRNTDGLRTQVCHGDSNTAAAGVPKWCTKLEEGFPQSHYVWINHGTVGASASDTGQPPPYVFYGPIFADSLAHAAADTDLFALGTNDVQGGATLDAWLAALLGYRAQAQAAGHQTYEATIIPTREGDQSTIVAWNAALKAAVPAAEIMDFYTAVLDPNTGEPDASLYYDHLHLKNAGQTKLANCAATVITQ